MSKYNFKHIVVLIVLVFQTFGWSQNELDSAQHYMKTSDFEMGQYFFQKWLNKNSKKGEKYIEVQMQLAYVDKLLHRFGEAMDIYNKIEDGVFGSPTRQQQIIVKIHMAELYRTIDNVEESLKIFRNMNFSKEDQKTYPELAVYKYHRYAASHNQLDNLDSALLYSLKSLELSEPLDLTSAMSTSYNEIANIYEKRRILDSAKYYYDKACQIWEEKGDLRYYSNAYFNRARVSFSEDDLDTALYMFLNNLEQIKVKDWPEVKGPIYHYVKAIYYAKGDSLSAVKYHIKQMESIIHKKEDEFDRDLLQVQTKYKSKEKDRQIEFDQLEIEKKESEISSRNQKITSLIVWITLTILILILIVFFSIRQKRTNVKLAKLLKENQFLLAESNHRIKNNLQLITSILNKEINKYEGKEKENLLEITGKIEAISTLHKQLYLKESKDLIDLKKYIEDIKYNYNSFYLEKNVKINLVLEEYSISIDKALYIGLLFTELSINSLKHAFEKAEHPTIEFRIRIQSNEIVIVYEDNGIGIDDETQVPKLAELMCNQLKGNYKFKSEEGFKLILKIDK